MTYNLTKIASVLTAAAALCAAPALAGIGHQLVVHTTVCAVAAGEATLLKDEPDSEEGDPEGGGVIDPTPQDDGSDGVDDGSGDA